MSGYDDSPGGGEGSLPDPPASQHEWSPAGSPAPDPAPAAPVLPAAVSLPPASTEPPADADGWPAPAAATGGHEADESWPAPVGEVPTAGTIDPSGAAAPPDGPPRSPPARAVAQPGRPAHPRPAALAAGHDRLGRDDRRRDRDRAAREGVRDQPVPDPLVVDGAHAALRPARRSAARRATPIACSRTGSSTTCATRGAARSSSSRRRPRPRSSAAPVARSSSA